MGYSERVKVVAHMNSNRTTISDGKSNKALIFSAVFVQDKEYDKCDRKRKVTVFPVFIEKRVFTFLKDFGDREGSYGERKAPAVDVAR